MVIQVSGQCLRMRPINRVRDVMAIARIGNEIGERGSELAPALGQRQQHDATVRGQTPAVERGRDFLGANRWQRKGDRRIVVHGGCASGERRAHHGLATHSLCKFNALHHTRQLKFQRQPNKMG